MKKLAFLFVAVAAISFASCGGNQATSTEGEDTLTVVEEEVITEESACTNDSACCEATDSVACDSAVVAE